VFVIVLDRSPGEHEWDGIVAAGLDDAMFGVEHGVPSAEFDREAPTLADAVAGAVRALESVELVALRVIDQDLVTLADIADRIEQSRESVRRYATGERGAGGFPPPANPARDGTVFYRWSEVVPWLEEHVSISVPQVDPALVFANLIVQARQLRRRVDHLSALTDLLAA